MAGLPIEFTYVRIPADAAAPMEELPAKVPAEQLGDALVELLKPRFAGGALVDTEGLRAQHGDAVDTQMEGLSLLAAEGTVEVRGCQSSFYASRPAAPPRSRGPGRARGQTRRAARGHRRGGQTTCFLHGVPKNHDHYGLSIFCMDKR